MSYKTDKLYSALREHESKLEQRRDEFLHTVSGISFTNANAQKMYGEMFERFRNAYVAQINEYEAALKDTYKKMKAEIEKIQLENTAEMQRRSTAEADMNRSADTEEKNVRRLIEQCRRSESISFFCPGRLNVYEDALTRAKYSAPAVKASLCSSCILGIKLLIAEAAEKEKSARMLLDVYGNLIRRVIDVLYPSDGIYRRNADECMTAAEADYFSDGVMHKLLAKTSRHQRIHQSLTGSFFLPEKNIEGIVITGETICSVIIHCISEAERLPAMHDSILKYAISAKHSLMESFEIMNRVETLLLQNGLSFRGNLYGPASETDSPGFERIRSKLEMENCTKIGEIGDYREARICEFTSSAQTSIRVVCLPVRHELDVSTDVYMEMYNESAPDVMASYLTRQCGIPVHRKAQMNDIPQLQPRKILTLTEVEEYAVRTAFRSQFSEQTALQ